MLASVAEDLAVTLEVISSPAPVLASSRGELRDGPVANIGIGAFRSQQAQSLVTYQPSPSGVEVDASARSRR